jgi:hypothetical protein
MKTRSSRRIKELKQLPKLKDRFEHNAIKKVNLQVNQTKNPEIAGSIITKATKSKIARKDFKEIKDTYDPAKHQEKIWEKRK